jgi:hypothetical protein
MPTEGGQLAGGRKRDPRARSWALMLVGFGAIAFAGHGRMIKESTARGAAPDRGGAFGPEPPTISACAVTHAKSTIRTQRSNFRQMASKVP